MGQSLQHLLDSVGNTVEMLRNATVGPNVYPGVPLEFTNWRDEQWAWQNTAVIYDLSYHMVDLSVKGPGALDLLSHCGYNTFNTFAVNQAKHYAPCTPEGYVIGDVILFYLDDQHFDLVGRMPALNWLQYQAEVGNFDVELELDQRWVMRTDNRRRSYRLQVQGPNAMATMEKVLGGPVPEVRFFRMDSFSIAGKQVRALRHGMAGQPGFELFGPWEDKEPVLEALVTAGEEFGLRRVGGRAYSSNTLDSGWIPSPLPAVYTGESLRAYREWLPSNGYEGSASVGGSFVTENIEDYYFTPWDLGYGGFVKFDHEFIGRDALEAMATDPPRTEVTLALNTTDVLKVIESQFNDDREGIESSGSSRDKGKFIDDREGIESSGSSRDKGKFIDDREGIESSGSSRDKGKFIEFPSAVYSMHPYDDVKVDGQSVGVSTWIGYSHNFGEMLTLAVLDNEHTTPGTEVTLIWGEPDGGTSKPTVEPHRQMEIRAIVSPVPYSKVARELYRR